MATLKSPLETGIKGGTMHLEDLGQVAWWRSMWTVVVLAGLGVFALITAVLVAWPALAYIASRFF